MGNILNHNRFLFDFRMTNEDYWDFHLSEETGYNSNYNELTTECLSAYIDFNDPECIFWDEIFSKNEYTWENAINNGVSLDYIGVTGVDNGFITFQKDRITNKEFLDIFLHSTYNTDNGDMRLRLKKVNGNNQIYDYSNNITRMDNIDVAELNGGFYQGFFKLYERQYQVLPFVIENGWSMEVKLKKSDLKNNNVTINDVHSKNKGIFLYIGTRAENKWFEKYKLNENLEYSKNQYNNDGYFNNEYTTENEDVNSSYIKEDDSVKYDYFDIVYYDENNKTKFCNQYVDDEYLEDEEEITGQEQLLTSDGIDFAQPNVIKYETDNKFLLFNRTDEGFTINNWEEGDKATIYDIKRPDIGNYHTIFNRGKNGYTIDTIDDLINIENKKYDIIKDLYRNALGFQIKDDGSIGFKYFVKDCDAEKESYKIEEMFTRCGVINNDEWYTISIKIVPTINRMITNPLCDTIKSSSNKKMVIYIYVNGKLKLKSKELPILNLKALDDLSDKQEGVPFSISLGGGTQGLCDMVNINYRELPKYVLPLETEFCGSFIGYIQNFRFYCSPLNFNEIKENYKYDINI